MTRTRNYGEATESGFDTEKNTEQTARANQNHERGGGEKPSPKAALVLTAFWFQFLPAPPFLKSQAKIVSNIFCLQFNSTPFPFKSLDACFLPLPWWRGEVATADERHLKGRASMRISEPPNVSSETSVACWLPGTGHCFKPQKGKAGACMAFVWFCRRKQPCEQAEPGCAFSFST